MGAVCIDRASRDRDADWFRLGLLRFLTRLSVLLNICAVLRSWGSGSSGSAFAAKGSMLRNEGEPPSKLTGDIMLLDRGGCCETTLADNVELVEAPRFLKIGSVDVLVSSLAAQLVDELGDIDLRESWTMQGFPEKTTETMRAMSWQVDVCSGVSCACSLSEL